MISFGKDLLNGIQSGGFNMQDKNNLKKGEVGKFNKCMSWSQTSEFVAPFKGNKYALYSLSKEKFITNYIFDKITYIQNSNYFVIKKSSKVQIIDTKGKVLDMKIKYPDNFNMEALRRFRNL